MEEIGKDSIEKSPILVSRNSPVALVVGVAGFVGSHLGEELLAHHIQVVGVDNFSTGNKKNLQECIKDKRFHFLDSSAEDLRLSLPRLDYIFLVAEGGWSVAAVLDLAKQFKSKIVFVSTIELYERKINHRLEWFKKAEAEIARFAQENKLNARVVRLAGLYGPRMHFRVDDPCIRLIQAALLEELQKEVALDFSSRALFIDDAVSLIVKSMLSGATASKIFDGVFYPPIKVAEIKQVLLDPIWHENRGFKPVDLPPWSTPNLEKTIKQLAWHPQTNLVIGLKKTLSYFKDNEVKIPELEQKEEKVEDRKIDWEEEKKRRLSVEEDQGVAKTKQNKKWSQRLPKISTGQALVLVGGIMIVYALFLPILSLSWATLTYRHNLTLAMESLPKGEFNKGLTFLDKASEGLEQANSLVLSMEIVPQMGLLRYQFEKIQKLVGVSAGVIKAAKHTTLGTQFLYEAVKTISGENTASTKQYLDKALFELTTAEADFARLSLDLDDNELLPGLPNFIAFRVNSLKERVKDYSELTKKMRMVAIFLPEVVGTTGPKSYLVVLQNNTELRPSGGLITAISRIDFLDGKLKKIDNQKVSELDEKLKLNIEPPKELKQDLGLTSWSLQDAGWEGDFPTAARQVAYIYTKATGEKIDGVVAIDLVALEELLNITGLSVEDLADNALTSKDQNYFVKLEEGLLNKLFFVPNINWLGIVNSLGQSFEKKHTMVYFADTKLFSFLISQNLAGAFPRPAVKDKKMADFLAILEANVGGNRVNFYVARKYSLETSIGSEGQISHRLKLTYINSSKTAVWPAGTYKNRVRFYAPFGSQLLRVLWGSQDITKEVSSFADYGRSGYSFVLLLAPTEEKALVLDWQLPDKIQFIEGEATYRLDVVKQAGTNDDPLEWKLNIPVSFKTSLPGQVISTDLSRDRRFEVKLTK
ncbi:DUF4012 domain-containing protein [Candidatus Daviesbacteria bacterium]|nr:DUF4012 domain-containing protein [Candidatus Daviesbacteria bacterium]